MNFSWTGERRDKPLVSETFRSIENKTSHCGFITVLVTSNLFRPFEINTSRKNSVAHQTHMVSTSIHGKNENTTSTSIAKLTLALMLLVGNKTIPSRSDGRYGNTRGLLTSKLLLIFVLVAVIAEKLT